jgi:hypothetical protein
MQPKIAIIGTAGRDKSKPMTQILWSAMVADAQQRILKGSHLVSGGAAWADHLAIHLFLIGHAGALTLHLPAPFQNGRFEGPMKSSGSTANYYHELFSEIIRVDTRKQIQFCSFLPNVSGSFEPAAPGYGGIFARNTKVAQADGMLAYTWGETSDQPADGGTLDTWNKCQGEKIHVPLKWLV